MMQRWCGPSTVLSHDDLNDLLWLFIMGFSEDRIVSEDPSLHCTLVRSPRLSALLCSTLFLFFKFFFSLISKYPRVLYEWCQAVIYLVQSIKDFCKSSFFPITDTWTEMKVVSWEYLPSLCFCGNWKLTFTWLTRPQGSFCPLEAMVPHYYLQWCKPSTFMLWPVQISISSHCNMNTFALMCSSFLKLFW